MDINKRILLIGGFGFLGSNILKWIDDSSLDFSVSVITKSADVDKKRIFNCISNIYVGDFSDKAFMAGLINNNEFDYIFHCLSTTVPATSNDGVIKDIETNLISTIWLLDLLTKKDKIAEIIFFSSGGAIYGNTSIVEHSETDRVFPISSYGILKNCIEHYIVAYHKLYGINYLSLRISNPYGPYHKSNLQGFINIATRKTIREETIEVWGDGNNFKDYIYAEDIPAILFGLLKKKVKNLILNVGSGTGTSINEILNIIRNINGATDVKYKERKTHDVSEFILNIDKLSAIMDFTLTPIRLGIEKTYEWEKHQKIKNSWHV